MLPSGLVEEIIDSLALLLPRNDKRTKQWFLKQREKLRQKTNIELDLAILDCVEQSDATRRLSRFKFLGERLEYLLQIYDDHEPSNLREWYIDDRRPAQKATFWIAFFAFLLALISIVLGMIQTWAAVKSLSRSAFYSWALSTDLITIEYTEASAKCSQSVAVSTS